MVERLKGAWRVSPPCVRVMSALAAEGATARFVGGCVRNDILGAPISDVDIAIDVPPEETTRLLTEAGIKAVPTGIDHGTITAVAAESSFEITTLRADTLPDGRRAQVAFGVGWEEDAARRDFTMNALYANADGTILDPLGGLRDVYARRVRFIGAATDRIREDFLRILRFFRFHAWYGEGDMEPDGLVACAGLAHGVLQLSRERVGAEMLKLLSAPRPSEAVANMAAVGVLELVLPQARPNPDSADALAALSGLEKRFGAGADPLRRLTAILRLGLADSEFLAVGRGLRLSRAQLRVIDRLMSENESDLTVLSARRCGYRLGETLGRDALLLHAVRLGTELKAGHLAAAREGAQRKRPLEAHDLISLGYGQGPDMGDALRWAEDRWIESDFSLDKRALIMDLMARRAAS